MAPPRWLPPHRRQPPTTPTVPAPPPPPGPNGFWITDPDFRDRLHNATLILLDIVEDCLNDDDVSLTGVLGGARDHAEHMLGIFSSYGVLAEAEAAAQIVQAAGLDAGSPFGLAVAQGLTGIEQLPVKQQQQLVRTAARRYAITAPSRTPAAPATAHRRPAPGRSR
ncbi:hypothetical protein [Streptomyces nanshensis]|uniref:hypothetical protein n=1 Tax=Streptomyces nanshensis TaxID=518642 RepID=UPI0009CD2025|nr:hypothetical protein [Streptomyces nanshensis]ONI48577.1 hypothetical protein STIB_72920 [Streptomyces sp. IB2014 011-1]